MAPRSPPWIIVAVKRLPTLCIALAGVLSLAARASAQPGRVVDSHAGRPGIAANQPRSIGSPNEGFLADGLELFSSSALHVLPGHTARFGLSQLVGMLHRSADTIAARFPGSVMRVGDLSRRSGGDVLRHRSHESGRDVDVVFYLQGEDGRPRDPAQFLTVDENGRTRGGLRFDDARNWALVELWLNDREARVTAIFIASHLRDRLLAFARASRASSSLLARAQVTLRQPPDALSHDDHFHVRIGCPPNQRGTCVEYVTAERRTPARSRRAPRR